MATACHPEDAVVCLNRGDYMLVTNNHKCYPCKKNGNKLIMKDGDDEYEFYRQTDDDDADDADDK